MAEGPQIPEVEELVPPLPLEEQVLLRAVFLLEIVSVVQLLDGRVEGRYGAGWVSRFELAQGNAVVCIPESEVGGLELESHGEPLDGEAKALLCFVHARQIVHGLNVKWIDADGLPVAVDR